MGDTAEEVGGSIVRLQLDGLVKICKSPVAVTLAPVGKAAVEVGESVAGLEFDHFAKVGDRGIEFRDRRMGEPAEEVAASIAGFEFDRFAKVGDRRIEFRDRRMGDAAVVVGASVVRGRTENLTASCNGGLRIIGLTAVLLRIGKGRAKREHHRHAAQQHAGRNEVRSASFARSVAPAPHDAGRLSLGLRSLAPVTDPLAAEPQATSHASVHTCSVLSASVFARTAAAIPSVSIATRGRGSRKTSRLSGHATFRRFTQIAGDDKMRSVPVTRSIRRRTTRLAAQCVCSWRIMSRGRLLHRGCSATMSCRDGVACPYDLGLCRSCSDMSGDNFAIGPKAKSTDVRSHISFQG